MKKENFTIEKDFVVYAECEECGEVFFEEKDECEECGGELINTTKHETSVCCVCKNVIGMWEDAYKENTTGEIICRACYDNIEEED